MVEAADKGISGSGLTNTFALEVNEGTLNNVTSMA
jgi:hypothetical protein